MGGATIDVGGEVRYRARVGVGVLAEVRELVADRRAVVVTDPRVRELHGASLGLDAPAIEVERGEAAKGLATLERVLEGLAEHGLDRGSVVVALGGGSVGDVAGLAASLFMRGVDWVGAPTTLLAQVDASIGGKTAINLRAGKNLAGAFHAPRAVFADTAVLATLEDADFRAGLGEVVKSALLAGEEALAWLEAHAAALVARDSRASSECVERSLRLKARLVALDPRERGERKLLNFGHTFAHAIEHVAGFGRVPHGVAVGAGVALALEAGGNGALLERVRRLLDRLGLPASLAALREGYACELAPRELKASMRLDKKGAAREPRFVLLDAPGSARWDVRLPAEVLERVLA